MTAYYVQEENALGVPVAPPSCVERQLVTRLSCGVGGVPTPSINADARRAQAASRAAEPPSVSSGTLDVAEHGGTISVDGVDRRKC